MVLYKLTFLHYITFSLFWNRSALSTTGRCPENFVIFNGSRQTDKHTNGYYWKQYHPFCQFLCSNFYRIISRHWCTFGESLSHTNRVPTLLLTKQEAQLLLGDRATRKHAKDSWNGCGNDNLGWNDLQMYSKVIKSGTNRKLVYDFLFVVYSNFCRITHRFLRNLMWNSPMTLKYAQGHWQSYHLKAVVWPCM